MLDDKLDIQEMQAQLTAVQKENEQLKRELVRLRGLLAQKSAGSMSSKLKDALRE